MTKNFAKWEVDPLFSAAEQVQDSADRLDSAYRTWVHMKSSLFDGEEAYLIEFRKRELNTALGTAKWQLEEFEKAIRTTRLQHHYYEEDDAPGRHNQFISAIQNQISTIEDAFLSSNDAKDLKTLPIVRVGCEDEKDDLEQFLCGTRNIINMQATLKGLEKVDERPSSSQGSVHEKLRTPEQIISSSSHSLHFIDCQMATDCVQMKDDHSDQTLCHSDSEILFMDHNNGDAYHRSISIGHDLSCLKGGTSNRSSKKKGNVFAAGDNKSNVFTLLLKMKHMFQVHATRSRFKRWKDGDSLADDQYPAVDRFSDEKEVYNVRDHFNASVKKHGSQTKAWGGTFHTLQCSHNFVLGRRLAHIASFILATFAILGELRLIPSKGLQHRSVQDGKISKGRRSTLNVRYPELPDHTVHSERNENTMEDNSESGKETKTTQIVTAKKYKKQWMTSPTSAL